ncbi:hypothetical protein BpOF4_21259 (plasmid) [Alkalihalophilus pseudofirmus OF4]|uniref:Uncharacterized protein n=1 Tax=Alkalihalophilus pseudofirmus (strain ATCC BAA-2126 / JCM 17055 / OF4) TaxID=398511 RepID=D3G1M1_ALKPO|nr:hypothetical protein BpOF4_21259 [Alkalihalophilus pseudofirmus OF4]
MFDLANMNLWIIGALILIALYILRVFSRLVIKLISVVFAILWVVRIAITL